MISRDAAMERIVKMVVLATRSFVALIAITSWVAISNHCAIRAATASAGTNHAGCPFHSNPAKSKPRSTECCRILRAISSTPVKALARAVVDLRNGDSDFAELVAPPKVCFTQATLDTGPPGKTFFADLIGSVHANAPPV
jgi:hypothetical protein